MDITELTQAIAAKVAPIREPIGGCSDHNCIFGHSGGMGTNGGCRCLRNKPEWKLRRNVNWMGKRIDTLLKLLDQQSRMMKWVMHPEDCPMQPCECGLDDELKVQERELNI